MSVPAGSGPSIAVVVLHWGARETTVRCLRSLRDAAWSGPRTVLLVDNTGRLDEDAARSATPLEVEILRPPQNLGFADGCTFGMDAAMRRGVDLILLLNNDAVVDPCFVEPLTTAMRDVDQAGLLSPQIVHLSHPEQAWYQGGRFSLWSGIPTQGHRRPTLRGGGSPRDVDYATGCAMLVRPDVIRRVGSFDSSFFAYCEDLDLSIRARRAGFRVLFVPGSLVYHDVGEQPERATLRIYYSTRNLIQVMRKHAPWYKWFGFAVNFPARWVGFFVVLALVRRQPRYLTALLRGTLDNARRRLGPSPWADDARGASRVPIDVPRS